ncbi:MAG TPA: DUF885 domain-containing protein [Terriglobales bacterium]|jgi:hypothetical protein|nr:DUF885 domain-containing protein [Terriglobales bacterium]
MKIPIMLFAFLFALALMANAQVTPTPASAKPAVPEWVQRSNENTRLVLESESKFDPEYYARQGVEGIDGEIHDLKPGVFDRTRAAEAGVVKQLEQRLTQEKDPLVRQDLEILLKAENDNIKGSLLQEKYEIPYFNVGRLAYFGVFGLLDDQVAAGRRPAALVRLRKYAGMEPGYTPIAQLAQDRIRERLNKPGLMGPAKLQVEDDLANTKFFVDGIGKLFEKYKIAGYEAPYAKLKEQLVDYENFVRKEILPRARQDFRLPPELYAFDLENNYGMDLPPAELAAMAHKAFTEIQGQMQTVAAQVAKEKGYKVTDYRDVIRELKKDQLVGDAILPHYQQRLKEIEAIITREHLVTLPDRPARIRLASDAETAAQPAPHMVPPRLLGNTGEQGEFVLPLNIPAAPGSKEAMLKYDDFTFAAASWTLTSHEARPGHELQFDNMIEKGVSEARALYAFNSVNVEGWGLYSEYIMQPFMPHDGQLISLQHRLMRATRAFVDPELQSGKLTPDQVRDILLNDVVLSPAMAKEEVERYTFRAPGQATSYFYGYTRLRELRADVEKSMGPRFDQQKYHDFIMAQGLLPPALLRKAVMEDFVTPGNSSKAGN